MSAVDTLRALAAGDRPRSPLLSAVRLESGGGLAYGEEAIVAAFRAAPLAIADDAITLTAPGHLAIFAGEEAILADLYGDAIARLWRLGSAGGIAAEPAVGVPFDADLTQARGDVMCRAADHPALAADAVAAVTDAARAVARGWAPGDGIAPYRARVFVMRAFGDAERAAALFAVHRLGGGEVRSIGFSHAAALIGGAGACIVRDRAGEAAVADTPWRASVV